MNTSSTRSLTLQDIKLLKSLDNQGRILFGDVFKNLQKTYLQNPLNYKIADQIAVAKWQDFLGKLQKLNAKIPLDYLLEEFELSSGLKMQVREGVFIPRVETEEWLQKIKDLNLFNQDDLLLDYGSGSGIISLTLKQNFKPKTILSCDKNPQALQTTKANFLRNNLQPPVLIETETLINPQIIFLLQKNQTENKEWGFICNPPYVPLIDQQKAEDFNVKYEPAEAIYSGDDGLDLFKKLVLELIQLIKNYKIKAPKVILFELDPRNIQEAQEFLHKKIDSDLELKLNLNFSEAKNYKTEIWKDFNGFSRVLIALQ